MIDVYPKNHPVDKYKPILFVLHIFFDLLCCYVINRFSRKSLAGMLRAES